MAWGSDLIEGQSFLNRAGILIVSAVATTSRENSSSNSSRKKTKRDTTKAGTSPNRQSRKLQLILVKVIGPFVVCVRPGYIVTHVFHNLSCVLVFFVSLLYSIQLYFMHHVGYKDHILPAHIKIWSIQVITSVGRIFDILVWCAIKGEMAGMKYIFDK